MFYCLIFNNPCKGEFSKTSSVSLNPLAKSFLLPLPNKSRWIYWHFHNRRHLNTNLYKISIFGHVSEIISFYHLCFSAFRCVLHFVYNINLWHVVVSRLYFRCSRITLQYLKVQMWISHVIWLSGVIS